MGKPKQLSVNPVSELHANLNIYAFKNCKVRTLEVHSKVLQKNPLRDPIHRFNPVLSPMDESKPLPVVFVLSGYSGNGPKSFAPKTFEENTVEKLVRALAQRKAPQAVYVFVEAMTFWGGSQFINSVGTGRYEDYVVKELVASVKNNFNVHKNPKYWCVTGGSSGGYGALHLGSKFPHIFGTVAAMAPDSFFSMSLLPEILSVKPFFDRLGGIKNIRQEIRAGKFLRRREAHQLLNVICMGHCYAPDGKRGFLWPIDKKGLVVGSVWKKWERHDPLKFFHKRMARIKKLFNIYLDVGDCDQYHLQYGCRQLHEILKKNKIVHSYCEFPGNHFDMGERRAYVWKWLNEIWSK